MSETTPKSATQILTKSKVSDSRVCQHNKTKRNGKDRNGNQRLKCSSCGVTWTDKRKNNGQDKSRFITSKNMCLDWLDGHSYRTLSRRYKMSPYYSHLYINNIIESLPDFRSIIASHPDRQNVEWVGIDGGYVNSTKGKISFLIAVELDTNTLCWYDLVKGENAIDIEKFIVELKEQYPNLKGITTDGKRSYQRAITNLNLQGINLEHNLCRVHIMMGYRSQSFHIPICMGVRKYKVDARINDFELHFRDLIFNSNDEFTFESKLNSLYESMKRYNPPLPDNYDKAVKHLVKQHKQHILNNCPRRYKTNNLVESWWNLLKTKFKTARTLGFRKIELWMNLFILRYHFNHLNYDGTVIDNGRIFKFPNLPSFESLLNQCESKIQEKFEQHKF